MLGGSATRWNGFIVVLWLVGGKVWGGKGGKKIGGWWAVERWVLYFVVGRTEIEVAW